jgi:cephalosporin hydroxylase
MTKYMEENLDMPLRELLTVMQKRLMTQSSYFGVAAYKSPLDHWIYQEIIVETTPDVIIEIGNAMGGSLLGYAHLCDLLGKGRVIGVDLSHVEVAPIVRQHPRVILVEGDACESFPSVNRLVSRQDRVLIIDDSSHTYEKTLNILRTYSPLVKVGDYFIVEDGICHHGLTVGPNPGPYEACETFVFENSDFEIDRNRESFLITWNPKGYLRRRELANIARDDKRRVRREGLSKESVFQALRLFIPPIVPYLIRKLRR